jgi:hypothetical protein
MRKVREEIHLGFSIKFVIHSSDSIGNPSAVNNNKGKGHPITGHQGPRGGVEV